MHIFVNELFNHLRVGSTSILINARGGGDYSLQSFQQHRASAPASGGPCFNHEYTALLVLVHTYMYNSLKSIKV